jgi:2-keto-3-deoxy-L-rhamnonate aldolase RhmA
MKTNAVRAKLKSGESSVGTWLALPDPIFAGLMSSTGFEWLTVELEHSPATIETAALSPAGRTQCRRPIARRQFRHRRRHLLRESQ